MTLCLRERNGNINIVKRSTVGCRRTENVVRKLGKIGKNITKSQAQRTLDDMKYNPEKFQEKKLQAITFQQLYDEFRPIYSLRVDRGDMPKDTLITFDHGIKRWLPYYKNSKITDLDEILVEEIINHLRIKKYAKDTVRLSLLELKRMLKYAKAKKYITEIPEIKNSVPTMGNKKPDYFTNEELDILINEGSDDIGFSIRLLINTGLRPHEFTMLKVRDIYDDKIVVHGVNSLGQLRSNKRGRELPITQDVSKLIQKRIQEKCLCQNDNISPFKTTPYFRRAIQRICDRVGLDISVKITKFRATFATRLAKNGVDVFSLCTLLGHSDPKTTLKFYFGMDKEHLIGQLEKTMVCM